MRIHDRSTRGAAALPIFVLTAGLVVGGCTSSSDHDAKPEPTRPSTPSAESVRLTAFDSCGALVDDFRTAATRRMDGQTGSARLPDGAIPDQGAPAGAPKAAQGLAADAAAPAAPGAQEHSTTNNQEQGVDEPDVVKTDGRRVLTVATGRLTVVDVATHRISGTLEVPGARASNLLLSGDRALLILNSSPNLPQSSGGSGKAVPLPSSGTASIAPDTRARFVLVDLTGAPRVIGDLSVDGNYTDGRQIGNIARIVVRSRPRLTMSMDNSPDRAKELIRRSTTSDWLPQFTLAANGRTDSGNLVGCDRVSRPVDRPGDSGHTGAATLSVLSFDLTRDLDKGDPVTVAADVDNVYATDANLYLATTTRQRNVSSDAKVIGGGSPITSTVINQLDISGRDLSGNKGTPKLVATGVVSGSMINRYAMSEHAGNLRVATTLSAGDPTVPRSLPSGLPTGGTTGSTSAPGDTTQSGTLPGGNAQSGATDSAGAPSSAAPSTTAPSAAVPGAPAAPASNSRPGIAPSAGTDGQPSTPPNMSPPIAPRSSSESAITVLARDGDRLTTIGRVGGLGRTERIMGVRFAGPIAYVVTFRQTDPLYTVDLRDPRDPKTIGELKLNGYSAYLHPIADGRLIGVGQDATDGGRRLGTQVSLFDVNNLAAPNRVAQYVVPGADSQAEQDAHAFLYWPKDGTVVVPVSGSYLVPPQLPGDRAQIAPGEKSPYGERPYALVLRIDGTRIVEVGRVTHPDARIQRSLVIGTDLWTVSTAGISVDRLADVRQVAWIPTA
ncbi:beta-propeller domain-containing protein [Embleya sp. AB8]|uniref:beta-propeller domain-containing protein n=1 Tax=Embleya sp. AB8 TaxID=3156304 RepID=UPI003C759CF2